MAEHNELGRKGEELARTYLIRNGYIIRECNWHFGNKEIDIIAEKDSMIVIVEVKTRSSDFEAEAQDTVTKEKQRFLINATHFYLNQKNIEKETRFDVITIIMSSSKCDIKHMIDAFYPTLK